MAPVPWLSICENCQQSRHKAGIQLLPGVRTLCLLEDLFIWRANKRHFQQLIEHDKAEQSAFKATLLAISVPDLTMYRVLIATHINLYNHPGRTNSHLGETWRSQIGVKRCAQLAQP